jgi:hypothetical protein
VVQNDEHTTARDFVGVIGVALGVDPLDLRFKLAEPPIRLIR